MTDVKKVETINFGETSVKVDDASDEVKSLVHHYNNANLKDANLTDELILIRTAKDSILAQIRAQLEKEQKEASEPTEDEVVSNKTDPTVVN